MELDPFLALEQTAPPSTQPADTASSDNVDPVASLLGDDKHEGAAPSAAAVVVIDRSSDEKVQSAAVKESVTADSSNAPEPVGQGTTRYSNYIKLLVF